MNLSQPNNLGKAVEVKASNRPIKIAHIIPRDETLLNHLILDAVFHESYTRWGGAYTLIVPASSKEFLHSEYGAWLELYDPDFVYTYIELDPSLIETIDGLCSPIAFLKHDLRGRDPGKSDWNAFNPALNYYFTPVPSITTVQSPQGQHLLFIGREPEKEITIATIYDANSKNRLFSDNFGGAFCNAVPGLFRTLCLAPPDLPKNHVVGTERCTSMTDMISALSNRKALPLARFAMKHSEAIPRMEPYIWAYSFNVFIGSTLLDRIHFWNARHFTPSYAESLGSVILETEFFKDDDLVSQLGNYLNSHNFLGQNNSPARVSIRSYSHTKEELVQIQERLRKHTWNSVFVEDHFAFPALPEERDFKEYYFRGSIDTTSFKLTEDANRLTAKEPSHFIYMPPRYKGLARGQWIVELDIQRHNNLSKYSNVVDTWELPKRRKIVRAFTTNMGKVTRSHRLALLPTTEDFPLGGGLINKEYQYDLSLPEDKTFFQHLVLGAFEYPRDDLRVSMARAPYQYLALSDKGQNLRGVISMFGDLSSTYEVLTKKYWRTVLRAAKEDSSKYLVFTREQLEGRLPNDRTTKQKLMAELRIDNPGKLTRLMKSSLIDTLEYLVRANIFYCVHQWRCKYCGHRNSRGFNSMELKNSCEICSTEYFAPIDLQWTYQLNEFVFRSLVKQAGLPVLWTLGFLQDRFGPGSFWYLPEVDLYENYDVPETKKEIDILCMRGGKFIAAEVKLSASQLINKPEASDNFVEKMNLIRPDIALLSFERFCESEEEVEGTKSSLRQASMEMQKRLDANIKLEVIVASEVRGFDDPSADLGWFGRRTSSMY